MLGARSRAIVTGVSGQDGFFLSRELLKQGMVVHGVSRRPLDVDSLGSTFEERSRFVPHELDILDQSRLTSLIREVRPDEIYNLAGLSSVSASFDVPRETWRTNADAVAILLEAVRTEAPRARVYQSSSGEMFGWEPGGRSAHSEMSAVHPQSPYAAAKCAAHLLCGVYRQAYGLRIACGILFNHESHRRSGGFLTKKVTDHVRQIAKLPDRERPVLYIGNLAAERDWGFAPEYVRGMIAILRQIEVRSAVQGTDPDDDVAANYRDYVLATGRLHAVWQLVDRAFTLAGVPLIWDRSSSNAKDWTARYESTGSVAVATDETLLRPSDPVAIQADPSRAERELGWTTSSGLDVVLQDMLGHG